MEREDELPKEVRELVAAMVEVHCARWAAQRQLEGPDELAAERARQELEQLELYRQTLIDTIDALIAEATHGDPERPHG